MLNKTSFVEIEKELKKKEFEYFKKKFFSYGFINIETMNDNWGEIYHKLKYIKSDKNIDLLSVNSKEYAFRFLVRGIVKIIKYNNDDEYIYDFRERGDSISDIGSVFFNSGSSYSITTVINCEWIELKKKDLLCLIKDNELIKSTFLFALTNILLKHENSYTNFRTNGAKERYGLFLEQFPEIVKYAKLSDIASYLGITLSSLCRIRKAS